jgi:hypothetical protein
MAVTVAAVESALRRRTQKVAEHVYNSPPRHLPNTPHCSTAWRWEEGPESTQNDLTALAQECSLAQ